MSEDDTQRQREALSNTGLASSTATARRRNDIGAWQRAQHERERQEQCSHVRAQVEHYDPPAYDSVRLLDLRIDERYQRHQNQNKVGALRGAFLVQACQPLAVSERSDGSRWVVDGQHRMAVLIEAGVEDWTALIYTGLSRREEAAMFEEVHARQTKPTMTDRFRAALVSGNREALAIEGLVTGAGLKINLQRPRGKCSGTHIDAIEALIKIFRVLKAPVLADVLYIIQRAWPDPHETSRTQRMVLLGIAGFLTGQWHDDVGQNRAAVAAAETRGLIDRDRVAQVIGTYTPDKWMAKARGQTATKPTVLFAQVVRAAYNRGRKRAERL